MFISDGWWTYRWIVNNQWIGISGSKCDGWVEFNFEKLAQNCTDSKISQFRATMQWFFFWRGMGGGIEKIFAYSIGSI